LLGAAGAGGYFFWRAQKTPPVQAPVAKSQPSIPAPEPVSPPDAPAIRHPVPSAATAGGLPSLAESDAYVEKALAELLGRQGLQFLVLEGAIRRIVATVDNLGRDPAPSSHWPVHPTAGRFAIEPHAGASVIAARNAERYAPFVRFASTVDVRRVAALYVRLYPLFQRAYEDLGYSGQYFNDRLVEVVDELIATPDLDEPLRVKRVQVEGAAKPTDGPGLYVFEDPAQEGCSAGQKILLRMGHSNAAALKRKLAELRPLIANPH
jgi:hypothetical protein